MRFLTDIAEKKRNIVEKIEKSDFYFNEEEKFLISIDDDIRRKAFFRLSLGKEHWKKGGLSFFKNSVSGEDIIYIEQDTFYYACLEQIDNGDLSDLEALMTYSIRYDEIEFYMKEKLKNPSYHPFGTLSNFIVKFLIETGRYDLFAAINQYSPDLVITSEIEDAILEHYPFAYSTLPFNISDEKLQRKRKNIKDLNVYELFKAVSEQRFYSNEQVEEIFTVLKEKLFSPNVDLSRTIPPIYAFGFEEFYGRLSSSEIEKFKNIMLHNNPKWYLERVSLEELQSNISTFMDVIKEKKVTFKENFTHEEYLLQNEDFLGFLLEVGNFPLLFRSPYISKFIPKIIAKLDERNPNFKSEYPPSKVEIEFFKEHPEVFSAVLRNNYYAYFRTYEIDYTLNEVAHKEAIQNKHSFCLPFAGDINALRELLSVGNVRCILENYSKFSPFFHEKESILLSEEECIQVIETLKTDIGLQNNVLQTLRKFVFVNPTLLQFYLHSNALMLEQTIDFLNHHEDLERFYTDELYQQIKEYYAEKYHLKLDKLDQLEHLFGPTIIRFFDNDNLQKITCLEDKKFEKLIALFPKEEYSMSLLETIYDSLKQYAFGKEHSDVISVFAHIKHSVQDETEDYKQDLENLLSVMDDKFYKRFGKKYPDKLEFCKQNPKEFLEFLITKMKSQNPEEKEEAMATLHMITDYFIATKREQYREEYHMIEDLHLPYQIDEKDFEKKLMFYLMDLNIGITVDKEKGLDASIVKVVLIELIKEGMDSLLAVDVLAYYLKQDFAFTNDMKTIQKNIKVAIPIIRRIVMKYAEDSLDNYRDMFDNNSQLKRTFYVPETELNLYQLLTSLRIDSLDKTILEDNPQSEEMYQSLLCTMKKYKLHKMPSCIKELLDSDGIQISCNLADIAGFISYYHQVYENEKRKLESQGKSTDKMMLTFTNIMINASVLSSVSSVYNQFLGTEDARLVKANPGPNYATDKTAGDTRLKEAVGWTLRNFQKTEVTIPTFSEVVSLGDKKMRVVVGNFTHPSNITHGERTGACMRIGGVGESLFSFCLEDKNGFHIRFEDEKTGEYISRVSGFRNGNTVFLNELRHSCNSELYNDEEIIEACRKISATMIEMSKDSFCPIENVVVTRAYATENLKEINLGISNNKKGLKAFYSDIQTSGVVLASTKEPYTNIELAKEAPTYFPAREKTYVGNNSSKLQEMMNRVHSVKQALTGNNYEYVEPLSFERDIVYGFANQDWYICMDEMGNIYEEIISIDKRAQEELDAARKLISEYVPVKKEEDTYQY